MLHYWMLRIERLWMIQNFLGKAKLKTELIRLENTCNIKSLH